MPKKSWTTEDDDLLINLVNEYINTSSRIKWKTISLNIGNKSPSSCFSRYNRVLSPDVINRNKEWTEEEDSIIKSLVQQRKSWSQIKKFLTGRSDLSIYNRWKSLLKKNNDQAKFFINTPQPSIEQLVEVALSPSNEFIPINYDNNNRSENAPISDILPSSDDEFDNDFSDFKLFDDSSTGTLVSLIHQTLNNSYNNYHHPQPSASSSSYDYLNYRMHLVFLDNPIFNNNYNITNITHN